MAKKIPLTGLLPNSSYSISIRGKSDSGLYTPWSKFNTFTTVGDNTAPSTPSAPTVIVTTQPQTVRVRHNGTKSAGGNLESDISHYEVYVNDTNSNSGGTQVGTIPAVRPGAGIYSEGNITINAPSPTNTKYFYVKVVDISGNRSSSSPTATASSIPYFSDAYISNLSADKITTGTLQANESINVGTTTPIVLKSNSTSPKGQIYIGTGEYGNANTPFYVASDNKFSLGTGLKWDGSTLTITGNGLFTGTVNASDGVFTGYVDAGGARFGLGWAVTGSTTTGIVTGNRDGTYKGIYINPTNFFGINTSTSNSVLQVGSSSSYLLWDQATGQLSIQGYIAVTGGSFTNYLTAGTTYIGNNISVKNPAGTTITGRGIAIDVNQTTLKTSNFWISDGSNPKFQVGNDDGAGNGTYMKWDATNGLSVKGNITSGSTVTGAVIKSGESAPNIILDSASPGKILFNISDAADWVDGELVMELAGPQQYPRMTIKPPTYYTWTDPAHFYVQNTPSGGAVWVQGGAILTLTGTSISLQPGLLGVQMSATILSDISSVREIVHSTYAPGPGDGKVGDVWLRYT